ATSITVTGLINSTGYLFRVAAKNAGGAGSYTESSSNVTPQPAFVSTWKTDNTSTGSSTSTQIKLPLESTGTYNFTVFWGDGTQNTITAWDDANATHTYAIAGTYTVTIHGTITGFRFNNSGDRNKITNISQFGKLNLGNNASYFYGASNLTITATDPLDLTGTTHLGQAFMNCTSLTTAPSMAIWDTSNVTNIFGTFNGATQFNQDIGSWNTAKVEWMGWLFTNSSFNQNIGNWNTGNVHFFAGMFSDSPFNQNIGSWNTAKATNMSFMFMRASAFNHNIGDWNTSNVTKMSQMFSGASAFNQNLSLWNVVNVTNMSQMFTSSGLTRTNYDPILLGWSAQNVKTSLSFHAGSAKYSQSAAVLAARSSLTTAVASGGKGWTITDGGGQAVAPGAPTAVSGTAGTSQISLNWTAPSDTGGSAITDYVVQYSSNGGSNWTPFADGTSTNTTATVTGLTNGTPYIFQVAAVNAAGTSSYSASSASVTPTAAACSGDCYTDAQSLAVGTERQGPNSSTLTLQYANGSSGFKIWKEKNGNRILNASGLVANGWQKALTRAGTGFDVDLTNSSVIQSIEGRVCPTNVFLSHSDMTATNRCLYYDSGNSAQRLDAAHPDQGGASENVEGEDWLQHSNSTTNLINSDPSKRSLSSYYEGNIKSCADKGMRLPVSYETTMTTPASWTLPTGDGGVSPVWATTTGVPSVGSDYTWTATSVPWSSSYYHAWTLTTPDNFGFDNYWNNGIYGTVVVRCVLPSH
ncbi:BspA family leucine-rich repeat surface protein, partial [bacterium]|nr:BspA family leucine-rich repeat surface protein [bacterium]